MNQQFDDEQMVMVNEKFPSEFTNAVNHYLRMGNYRVVATEMSVTDHHYFALLVRRAPERR